MFLTATACLMVGVLVPAASPAAEATTSCQLNPTAPGCRVLILDSSVTGGMQSIEATEAAAQGYGVDVVSDAQWRSMTRDQFANYRAIVLGDPTCGTEPAIAAAEDTVATWGPVINGNVMIVGTDPVYHNTYGQPGGGQLTRNGIDFVLGDNAGRVGAYISLSCYYHDTAPHTPIKILDAIRPGGFTATGVGCYNESHIVAVHPALSGLTDSALSGWSCSVHEAFDQFPADFVPLAIAKDFNSSYTASDGTQGPPYILVSGFFVHSYPLWLTPLDDSAAVGGSHTVLAQLLDPNTNQPAVGVPVTIGVTSGPNTGVVGVCDNPCTTASDGSEAWTYHSNGQPGDDTITAFLDNNHNGVPDIGEPQTTARMRWNLGGERYVAFGDSLTTGFSIPKCKEDRSLSPWGCYDPSNPPPATPYPDKVAQALGYSTSDNPDFYRSFYPSPGFPSTDLDRVGIWGYTAQEAAADDAAHRNQKGPWVPEYQAVRGATSLVTGELGVNDLRFSDVAFWASKYLTGGTGKVRSSADGLLNDRSADLDAEFASLVAAKQNGATVVVTQVYNPYDNGRIDCKALRDIGQTITNEFDDNLAARAGTNGLRVADFRPSFLGHGAGQGSNSYVFGTDCSVERALAEEIPSWVPFVGGGGEKAIKRKFDPHPNDKGTTAMANAILGVLP